MPSKRVCPFCGKAVGCFRRSDFCSTECKRHADYEKRKGELKSAEVVEYVVIHRCVSPELDLGDVPDFTKCGCLEQLSEKEIKARVDRGEIVWIGDGKMKHACYSSKLLRAPRVQTIERAHIERAYATNELRRSSLDYEATMAAGEREEASVAQTERARIEYYAHITKDSWLKLIREVPAEEYDRVEAEQRGRQWLGSIRGDVRDKGSIGRDFVKPLKVKSVITDPNNSVKRTRKEHQELEALIVEQQSGLYAEGI